MSKQANRDWEQFIESILSLSDQHKDTKISLKHSVISLASHCKELRETLTMIEKGECKITVDKNGIHTANPSSFMAKDVLEKGPQDY